MAMAKKSTLGTSIEKDGQEVPSQREHVISDLSQIFADHPEAELTDEEAMALVIREIKAARAEQKTHPSPAPTNRAPSE